jgi:rRNA maturation protein Rpf1
VLILLTTSRRPTRAIRALCRDLSNSLPNVVRVNRGKMNLDGIAERAIGLEADRVVLVDRWRGGPGKISLFRITPSGLKLIPPLMLIAGVRLRRELKEDTRRTPSSVVTIDPDDSPDLKRIARNLSQFFDLPALPIEEASKKHSASMHFSFDSPRHPQITFLLLSRMIEIGPKIIISKLIWEGMQ